MQEDAAEKGMMLWNEQTEIGATDANGFSI
jgi:hypothetical protein